MLTILDAADRLQQFRLPRRVQFDETVDTAIKEPNLVLVTGVCRRKQREKFAARRMVAATLNDRSPIHPQKATNEEEKPRQTGLAHCLLLIRGRRQNQEILCTSERFLDRTHEQWMRTDRLDCDRHVGRSPDKLLWAPALGRLGRR